MHRRINLSAPDVGELEETYVLDALRSGWVAPIGPHVDAFERELAARAGTTHAVALSSGTAALHLALHAAGTRPGDVVIVPTLTFVATANAVTYTGAEPVFIDCDEATGNIDSTLLAPLIDELRADGRQIAAVVPVDLLGSCADYDTLLPICAAAGIPVIEDAAEALGASYAGRPAGSFGRAGILSFNGNKIMTTSGGGALVCDDPHLAARVRYLSTQARQPLAHYEHTEVGFNYRLSNVLAALGRAQLARLDQMIGRRRSLREGYAKAFAGGPGVRVLADADTGANTWLTAIIVDPAEAGWAAADLGIHLAEQDIETRPLWKPMHLQPVYAGARGALTGAAERLFDTGLALPSGSELGTADIARIGQHIDEFLQEHR